MPNIAIFHPQIVHFVIALLIVGVIFRVISLTGRFKFTDHAATTLILIGTVAAWFAVKSGDQAHGPAERIPGAREAVENHEQWGERTRNLFILVSVLEIATLALRASGRKRVATGTAIASAVIGLGGIFFLYETGEHGGQIVYEFAGGAGTRSGDPKHVENVLVAGLYHQTSLALREKRADEANRLLRELALRRPGDRGVRILQADAHVMNGHKDSALMILDQLIQENPERATRLKAKADSLRMVP
jgi:uncharacterized membrane protein